MRTTLLCVGFVAVSLLGCADDGGVEDGADDPFQSGGKSDAFGVEDWSPDGAAVLALVSSADRARLHDDVGLSTRVATSIVEHRAGIGGTYTNLAQLDAAKWVGKAVFARLLHYVTDQHLFKTAMRVPLLVEDVNGDVSKPLASYNSAARAAGLPEFPDYIYLTDETDYSAAAQHYDEMLQALATKSGMTIEDTTLLYRYSLADFTTGDTTICYVGEGDQVADAVTSQTGYMLGEMYSIWGWRHAATKWIYDTIDDEAELGDDFVAYDEHRDDVLIVYSNNDSGDISSSDVVARCR